MDELDEPVAVLLPVALLLNVVLTAVSTYAIAIPMEPISTAWTTIRNILLTHHGHQSPVIIQHGHVLCKVIVGSNGYHISRLDGTATTGRHG